jgi:hypothetical protein
MPDFNGPDLEYGGGGPSSYKSADGTRFWGALVRQGGVLKFVVYQTDANGGLLSAWDDSGILGQGAGLVLQPDGGLEAQGFVNYGDNASMRAVPVPGWKPWPGPKAWLLAGFMAFLPSDLYDAWRTRLK